MTSAGPIWPHRRIETSLPTLDEDTLSPSGVMGRRAETEMVQDAADRDGVGDVGNDLERADAAFADERIHPKDLGDEARPAWGAAALLGLLLPHTCRPRSSDGRSPRTRLA